MYHPSHDLRPDSLPIGSPDFCAEGLVREGNGNGHQAERHGLIRRFCKGELLFIEGGEANGVFVLREGSVKLSTTSAAGRTVTLVIAGSGYLLGLAAVLAANEYDVTAEALDDCSAEFVPRDRLLRQLSGDAATSMHAARQLARDYLDVHKAVSSLVRSETVLVRLARLFLSWAPDGNGGGPVRVTNAFTHQQLAEMIGTTRETVTRSLRELRERDLATLKGRDLVIHHHERLRLMTANGNGHCDYPHRRPTAE